MPVLSSRLIQQSDLYCTNWGLWWADLGSPTAPRLHGSIQRACIERLSYARRSLGAGEETQPRPPVVEADREGPSAAADVVRKPVTSCYDRSYPGARGPPGGLRGPPSQSIEQAPASAGGAAGRPGGRCAGRRRTPEAAAQNPPGSGEGGPGTPGGREGAQSGGSGPAKRTRGRGQPGLRPGREQGEKARG